MTDINPTEPRPNLVFVFPDEMRPQAMGFMNADPVVTPNLDRLASEGIVLTHAVSNRPVCSPYRAMLLTGKYPHANRVLTNCHSGSVRYGNYLQDDDRCISDVLHSAGYSLGYIGKWHLDPPTPDHNQWTEGPRGDGKIWDSYTPPERRHGFDFWHTYGCCDRHFDPHYWHCDATVDERIDPGEWSVKHETDIALDFIRNVDGAQRDADQPFALFVSHNPPHMPFNQVPPQYVDMYADRTAQDLLSRPNVKLEGQGAQAEKHVKNYFAAVTGIDEQFGRILDCLDELDLGDNTIVVFSADHGEMMGSHGRMHKVIWYDESLLIPFIIRWPARLKPRTDDLLLSVPDTMPTLLGLMGLADRIPNGVEGTDYAGVLLDSVGDRPSSALYLDVDPTWPEGGKRGLRTARYTFVVIREKDGEEETLLFDNEQDPWQLRNVADQAPAVVEQLTAELNDWLRRTNDPWL